MFLFELLLDWFECQVALSDHAAQTIRPTPANMSQPVQATVVGAPTVVQATVVSVNAQNNNVQNTPPQWRFGLCDFCALPTLCINAMCCSACVLAQTAGRAKEYLFVKDFKTFLKMVIGIFVTLYVFNALSQAVGQSLLAQYLQQSRTGKVNEAKATLSTYSALDTIFGLIISVFGFAYMIITLQLRLKVRAQKNIPPNLIEDVVCTVCCPCCVVIQTAREVGVGEECMNMKDPNNDPATMQMSRSNDGSATGFDKV